MDHLPRPQASVHAPLEIPYLDDEDYDGGEYETYPDRRGWGPRTVKDWYELFESPTPQFQAFLQTWLFFGLISETLGQENVHKSQLIRQVGDPSRRVVDTSVLIPLERIWNEKLYRVTEGRALRALQTANAFQAYLLSQSPPQDPSDGSAQQRLDTIRPLVCGSTDASRNSTQPQLNTGIIDYIHLNPVPKSPHDPRVELSIHLLIDLVLCLRYYRPPFSMINFSTGWSTRHNLIPRWESIVTSRMRAIDHWCPYQISMLHERLNAPALTFVSNTRRPDNALHPSVDALYPDAAGSLGRLSTLCTTTTCGVTHLDPGNYTKRHVDGCVTCEDMAPDESDLLAILETGSFPLILSIDEDEEGSAINLVDASPDVEYVAISHVWSDGLGNTEINAIPRCQMMALSRMVRNLPGNASNLLLFWLDTICVPRSRLDDARTKQCKKLAISRMRDTYLKAKAVTVLDAGLISRPIAGLPHSEVLLNILSSNWNTRLWTLQEGAFAQQLLFQFADKIYDSDEGISMLVEEEAPYLNFTLKPTIYQRWSNFRGLNPANSDPGQSRKLVAVMQALKVRSTSFQSDEAICVATLLGLDVNPILNADPQLRMLVLWGMIQDIPARMVFYNAEKLNYEGLRWAPASLLRVELANKNRFLELPNYTDVKMGHLTWNGLCVKYPGFIVKAITGGTMGKDFYFIDNNNKWYLVTLRVGPADPFVITYTDAWGMSHCGVNPWSVVGEACAPDWAWDCASLVIILEAPIEDSHKGTRGLFGIPVLPPGIPAPRAAHLHTYETYLASSMIRLKSVCTVNVRHVTAELADQVMQKNLSLTIDHWVQKTGKSCAALRDEETGISWQMFGSGIQTRGDQEWCVD